MSKRITLVSATTTATQTITVEDNNCSNFTALKVQIHKIIDVNTPYVELTGYSE
jgi:hypothetical protein